MGKATDLLKIQIIHYSWSCHGVGAQSKYKICVNKFHSPQKIGQHYKLQCYIYSIPTPDVLYPTMIKCMINRKI